MSIEYDNGVMGERERCAAIADDQAARAEAQMKRARGDERDLHEQAMNQALTIARRIREAK